MVQTLARHWRWIALRGVVAILFGLATFLNPAATLLVLVVLFGAYAIVDGTAMVISALGQRHEERWGTLLVGGIIGILAGALTLFVPGLTVLALVLLIGAWALVMGVIEIAAAVRLRREITGEWMFIVAGCLAVIFGLLVVAAPSAGALVIMLWLGAYALVSGILLVALGFRLRSWTHAHAAT